MATSPSAWRAFLGEIIREPEERKRLASELDVNEITLGRWASREPGAPRPHLNNLYRLVEHVAPKYRDTLIALLQQDFPDIQLSSADGAFYGQDIAALFYRRVLDAYNTISEPQQRFWTITHLVLQQALGQLDPNHQGVGINLMLCLPSSQEPHVVRSIYRSMHMGSGRWRGEGERLVPLLMGAETLPGYAIATCQPAYSPQMQRETILPIWPVEDEENGVAYPIMRHGRMAGAVYAVSSASDFFTRVRRELLEQYTQLLSLAFDTPDFFDPQHIRLHLFPRPHQATQQPYFASFRQQISRRIAQAVGEQQPPSLHEVELMALQHIEQAILDFHPASLHTNRGEMR